MKLSRCLSDLGIDSAEHFAGCNDIDEEFKVIKKTYMKKILKDHPDKGGDAATFRTTQTAWEILRDLFHKNKVKGGTYVSYFGARAATADDDESYVDDGDDEDDEEDLDDELYQKYASNTSVPSYEFFAAAAEEEVPGYKVELAKSGRSKCAKCDAKISKDTIRVGSLDKVSGTYGRWNHLECWRVPVKVQNGLTDPSDEAVSLRDLLAMEEVLLTGVDALDHASKVLFVQHCVDSENWARNRKRKQIMGDNAQQAESKGAKVASKSESASAAAKGKGKSSAASNQVHPAVSNNIVPGSFVVLVPGVDGALSDKVLRGKTFVISGTFPEVGGGDADAVGVANLKAMISSFSGKVITRFSKNTNFLLAGKDPAASRFKDAKKRSIDIISLRRLQGLLLGHISLKALKTMPDLSSDQFMGVAYQAAGAPPPPPSNATGGGDTVQQPSASASSAKQPANVASMPKASKPSSSAARKEETPPPKEETPPPARAIVPNQVNSSTSAIVAHTGKKAKFTCPIPGRNGAVAGVLDGKRFVLTGVFPELGGGTGLSLGKDRVTALVEAFGGRVTSAVSGKTDFVLVGKDPGRSKVSQADKRGVPLIDLLALQRLLLGQKSLEATASAPPPRITNFSAGYPGQQRIAY